MPKAVRRKLEPYWEVDDLVRLYCGDALAVLRRLPSESIHTAVTSPPYWGLRDYGVDGQLGSEKTSEEFVDKMVEVFRELRRVLRKDGTTWLNIGGGYGANGQMDCVPFRLAIALQADGWILRQDIIWSKPSPMPESVRNRCTKAHEYVFLLAKAGGYYYDQEACKEVQDGQIKARRFTSDGGASARVLGRQVSGNEGNGTIWEDTGSRNKRSVWNIASQGYGGAHFAVFPEKLIEPCILAGCPERCCRRCGTPYLRQVESTKLFRERPNNLTKRKGLKGTGNFTPNDVAGVSNRTVGWEQQCSCKAGYVGGIVLDPFCGSGTTCAVALRLGRRSIGIDLSEEYLRNHARVRIEGVALSIPELSGRVARVKPIEGESLI